MKTDYKRRLVVGPLALMVALGTMGMAMAVDPLQDETQGLVDDTAPVDPDGFSAGLVEALLQAREEGKDPMDAALAAAEAAVAYHLGSDHRVTSQGAAGSLQAQANNLVHARQALELIDDGSLGSFEKSIRLAQLGILWQTTNLGLSPQAGVEGPVHEAPAEAVQALVARHDVSLDNAQTEAITVLDSLEPDVASALAGLVDSLVALETAVDDLSLALPEPTTSIAEQAQILDLVERVEAGEITTHEEMTAAVDAPEATERAQAPSELAAVLVQRVVVLDAVLALQAALGPGGTVPLSDVVDVPGLVRIDLRGEDSHYDEDYHYIVEAGGANVYHNNAGGSNVGGGSCFAEVGEPTTAALVDLGTQDKVFGDPENRYNCGANGGGFAGFDHGNVGVGLLVTAGGDNSYIGTVGANGGGHGQAAGVGVGLAVDADGANVLNGGSLGVNGAGSNGYFADIGIGVGLLVLGGEDGDVVDGFSIGTNGGAVEWGAGNAHGGIISVGGDDQIHRIRSGNPSFGSTGGVYTRSASVAYGFIVNGGGSNLYDGTVGASGSAHTSGDDSVAAGFLLDKDGGGTFTGNHQAVNGAVRNGAGSGMLISGEGDDAFQTNSGTGANGGGHRANGGRAFLIDAGGNDLYQTGRDVGTNGGAYRGETYGLLFDLGGDDTYVSERDRGVNGGVGEPGCLDLFFLCVSQTNGLLLDAGGTDNYEDDAGGTGVDHSVYPKGDIGAQVDSDDFP